MELSLSARTVGGHRVLDVAGEVDVYTAPQLRECLINLVEEGARQVVIDLGRVEFLDSTGLGVLVGALKRLRGVGGELALVCAQERLLKIFRITGLDRVFALYGSVEAVASAGPATPGSQGTSSTPGTPGSQGTSSTPGTPGSQGTGQGSSASAAG